MLMERSTNEPHEVDKWDRQNGHDVCGTGVVAGSPRPCVRRAARGMCSRRPRRREHTPWQAQALHARETPRGLLEHWPKLTSPRPKWTTSHAADAALPNGDEFRDPKVASAGQSVLDHLSPDIVPTLPIPLVNPSRHPCIDLACPRHSTGAWLMAACQSANMRALVAASSACQSASLRATSLCMARCASLTQSAKRKSKATDSCCEL